MGCIYIDACFILSARLAPCRHSYIDRPNPVTCKVPAVSLSRLFDTSLLVMVRLSEHHVLPGIGAPHIMSVNPKQLFELLAAMIPARLPLLITGAPGVGKSDIIGQAAAAASADLIISHPAVADPTDAKGLPWPVSGGSEATFLPFGELATAIKATNPTVWLLDDLGQATPAVQASFMQLILARRVNGHKLPECVTFVAATNRRTDRAGVSGILEPVKSRFAAIVELEPTIDDWCNWAYSNGIPPALIAFLRYRSDLLSHFEPSADITNSPVPRTWANLARLESLALSPALEATAMAGAVGEGAATEYLAFRSMVNSLVNIDAILAAPDKAPIPSKPSELYAVAVGLAGRANPNNFARVITYATRLMTEADRGEFAVLTVRDSLRRDFDNLSRTDSFVRMQSGPLGQLISGKE